MTFDGWPTTATEFYAQLEVNNTKEFWTANKATYDADVRAPMEALTEALAEEFGEAKIFRPYRDVRFSKDKTPYKTEVGAVLHSVSGAVGYYVRFSADGLGAGGGGYQLDRGQLERYRKAVDAPSTGQELVDVVAGMAADGVELSGEALKTAPRGYPKDHPRIELLRRKGLFFFRDAGPDVAHTPAALDWVRDTFRLGHGLVSWLETNVGPATEERRR